jgi:hypothetical protein
MVVVVIVVVVVVVVVAVGHDVSGAVARYIVRNLTTHNETQ